MINNEEILPFATTWMDLEDIMLSEMSERERQILCDLIYIRNLKKKKKPCRKRDQTCDYQRQMMGEGEIGGM